MSEPLLLSRRLEPATAASPDGSPLLVLALDAGERQRLRGHCRSLCGRDLLLQLPREGGPLRPQERLAGDDGIPRVRVEAAPEALLRVHSDDPFTLLRAAYHLGNRHVALELRPGELRLPEDPVLADLLRGLGLSLETIAAPFEPESGAYASGHGHRHATDPDLERHAPPGRHSHATSSPDGEASGPHHPHRP